MKSQREKEARLLKRQGRAVALLRQGAQLLQWAVLPVGGSYLIGPKQEVMTYAALAVEAAQARVQVADSLEIKSHGENE